MYIPPHFSKSDSPALQALIATNPLGTWILNKGNDIEINHIPFLLDAGEGPHGTLSGHVARVNTVWQDSVGSRSAVIFTGAQGYISPSWYPSKQQHHRAVPTWNYAVVHAHGVAEIVEDRTWLLNHISQLSNTHEASQTVPWRITDAPADFIENMLGAIIGIRIRIDKLVGKFKLSQNRTEEDQLGVLAGLADRQDIHAKDLADFMKSQRFP